jgi:hypothetical protein
MDSTEPERRQGQAYASEEIQVVANWPQTQPMVQQPQPPQGWQQNVQYVTAPTVNIGNEGAPAYYSYALNTSNWAQEVEQASRASDPLGLSRDIEMSSTTQGGSPAPIQQAPPTTVMAYSTQPSVTISTPTTETSTVASVPAAAKTSSEAIMPPPGMTAYRKKPLDEETAPKRAQR